MPRPPEDMTTYCSLALLRDKKMLGTYCEKKYHLFEILSSLLAVRTAKKKASPDSYMAVLSYRTTLIPQCRISPCGTVDGMLYNILQVKKHLVLNWLHVADMRVLDKKIKASQRRNYDNSYWSNQFPELPYKLPV